MRATYPSLRSIALGLVVGTPGYINHRIPTRREPRMSASAPEGVPTFCLVLLGASARPRRVKMVEDPGLGR